MNKITISTSLGIIAVVLVAFVSFGMMDTNDISKTDTKLVIEQKQYTTSGATLPPDDPMFSTIDFDTHLDNTEKYGYLTEIFEKYDDILVVDVYTVYEYDKSEEAELLTVLRSAIIEEGEAPLTEDDIMEQLESFIQDDGKVLDDYTVIYLSQDPLDEDVYYREFTYTLQGISIKITPKGELTEEIEFGHQFPREIIYEVSPRIIGELTPMDRVIQFDEPFDRPTTFGFFDDENYIGIRGFLTNEQVSALAMAISEDKK